MSLFLEVFEASVFDEETNHIRQRPSLPCLSAYVILGAVGTVFLDLRSIYFFCQSDDNIGMKTIKRPASIFLAIFAVPVFLFVVYADQEALSDQSPDQSYIVLGPHTIGQLKKLNWETSNELQNQSID